MIARRLAIRGLVQGVGYRYSMVGEAQRAGVRGWVRNVSDGTVEAFVQGEERAVERVIDWCRRGPRGAHVTTVDVEHVEADENARDFSTRPSR